MGRRPKRLQVSIHGLSHPPPWRRGCKNAYNPPTPGLTNSSRRLGFLRVRNAAAHSPTAHGDLPALDPPKWPQRPPHNSKANQRILAHKPKCGSRGLTVRRVVERESAYRAYRAAGVLPCCYEGVSEAIWWVSEPVGLHGPWGCESLSYEPSKTPIGERRS